MADESPPPGYRVAPPLVQVNCSACGNHWFVRDTPDFWPAYCCFCGVRFVAVTPADAPRRPYNEGAFDD